MPETKTLTPADLDQFYGTENYYKHSLMRNVVYTDGVRYVAQTAGAYWLIDEIATTQLDPRVRPVPFQTWTLEGDQGTPMKSCAVLTCTNDQTRTVVYRKKIEFTDFPLFHFHGRKFELKYANNVIYLERED